MNRRMNKAEADAFKKRWQIVNKAERDEMRTASYELKFRQLAALMASVADLGWQEPLDEGVAEVRARWARLRRLYGV
jgi:hypothetical protein